MNKLCSISREIRNNAEFKELQSNIAQLMKSADALESKVNTIKESAVKQGSRHLDQVERLEQGLIEKIKAHSASLKDAINIATSEAKYQLDIVIDMCTDIKSSGEQLSNDLNDCNGNDSEVIAFVKAKPVLQSKTDELNAAGKRANLKQYRFKKCVDLDTMLQTTKSFRSYEVENEEMQSSQSTGRPDIQSTNIHQHTEATGYYIYMSP